MVQQCFVLKLPQIQFIDSGWIFLQRWVPTVQTVKQTVEFLQLPLLDQFLTCPLLCNARCAVRVVKVVDISVVAQMQFPLVLNVQNTIEILQLQFIDKVIDACCAGPASSRVQSVRRQSRSHSCSSLKLDTVVHMPVVVQRQMPDGSDVRKL